MTRRAFTLVELLVVIGIISLLIAILIPSLSSARRAAARVKASSDLRQLTQGYVEYTLDNKSSLPFGYPPYKVDGVTITATRPDGTAVDPIEARRYPWRLIKYTANAWQLAFYHRSVPEDTYTKSLAPGFGINSVFLGGHQNDVFAGFIGTELDGRPNRGKHVLFKSSEIRSPSEQIVFAESVQYTTTAGPDNNGSHYVLPPRGNSIAPSKRWWTVSADGKTAVPAAANFFGGVPNSRFKSATLVGFFDGHVAGLTARELDDMRLWNTGRAKGPDWDFVP